jgi:hypothetical protein
MATDEFTLDEAQAKRGQIVRSRPSVPWPDGVLGEIVDVGFSQAADGHPPARVVFTLAWQLFPQYGAVPCTRMPLSKSQYQDSFQEIYLTDEEHHQQLFGEQRAGSGHPATQPALDDGLSSGSAGAGA